MIYYRASYFNSRGQIKIQEMAFVLVAIMVLFAIVALFFISFRTSGLRDDASLQREDEAKALVRKITDSPEFAWTVDQCYGCIDLDKVMALKEKKEYNGFWNIDRLYVKVFYPNKEGECNRINYPDCGEINIINNSKNVGIPVGAFVSLCRQEFYGEQRYSKCELGKIYASAKEIK